MYPDLAGISLVFEYMPHTLYSKLKDEENPLSRATVRRYTAMLLRGLAYLHGVHIMHRDIKPANLLIDRHDVLKIADFGLARIYTDPHLRPPDRPYSPQVATRWYRAPEILWGCQRYGPSIDLWATGAVFAEMLRGVPLFAGATDIEQLALVVRTLGTPNLKDWPEVRSLPDYNKIRFPNSRGERWEDIFPSCTTRDEIGLVDGLVRYNPAKRLTAEEVRVWVFRPLPSSRSIFYSQPPPIAARVHCNGVLKSVSLGRHNLFPVCLCTVATELLLFVFLHYRYVHSPPPTSFRLPSNTDPLRGTRANPISTAPLCCLFFY